MVSVRRAVFAAVFAAALLRIVGRRGNLRCAAAQRGLLYADVAAQCKGESFALIVDGDVAREPLAALSVGLNHGILPARFGGDDVSERPAEIEMAAVHRKTPEKRRQRGIGRRGPGNERRRGLQIEQIVFERAGFDCRCRFRFHCRTLRGLHDGSEVRQEFHPFVRCFQLGIELVPESSCRSHP